MLSVRADYKQASGLRGGGPKPPPLPLPVDLKNKKPQAHLDTQQCQEHTCPALLPKPGSDPPEGWQGKAGRSGQSRRRLPTAWGTGPKPRGAARGRVSNPLLITGEKVSCVGRYCGRNEAQCWAAPRGAVCTGGAELGRLRQEAGIEWPKCKATWACAEAERHRRAGVLPT